MKVLALRSVSSPQEGTVRGYAELARLGGVSRARMTQIMSLRNLAPVIQERILGPPAMSATSDAVNEQVSRVVAQRWDWREQMRMWEQMEGASGRAAEVLRAGSGPPNQGV
jgi:hypothetical protein